MIRIRINTGQASFFLQSQNGVRNNAQRCNAYEQFAICSPYSDPPFPCPRYYLTESSHQIPKSYLTAPAMQKPQMATQHKTARVTNILSSSPALLLSTNNSTHPHTPPCIPFSGLRSILYLLTELGLKPKSESHLHEAALPTRSTAARLTG